MEQLLDEERSSSGEALLQRYFRDPLSDDAREAAGEILDRYRGRVAMWAMYRFGLHSSEAEGAADSVLSQAWEKLAQLRAPEAFSTWLYTITRSVCANVHRSGRIRRIDSALYTKMDAERRHTPSPLEILVAEEDRVEAASSIHEALGSLTDVQRRTLHMREIDGQTYEEIAGILGCPVGTVKQRVYYARRALWRYFGRQYPVNRYEDVTAPHCPHAAQIEPSRAVA